MCVEFTKYLRKLYYFKFTYSKNDPHDNKAQMHNNMFP